MPLVTDDSTDKIIVQHNRDEAPNYHYRDGGDSCARTGLLAPMYLEHRKNMPLFVVRVGDHYEIVRHPYQDRKADGMLYNFNDPRQTSRDNVIQWANGVDENSTQKEKDACYYYAQRGWVNKDFLDPACRLYLYKKSGRNAPWLIKKLGSCNMRLSLWFNTKVKPHEELNQFTCICRTDSYYASRLLMEHPNLRENLIKYWAGWRDQIEIAHAHYDATVKAAGMSVVTA